MRCKVSCPSCGKSYAAPEHYLGRKVTCPACHATFRVPATKASLKQCDHPSAHATPAQNGEEFEAPPDAAVTPTAGRLCPECGTELSENAILCVSCGYNLSKGKRMATAKEEAREDNLLLPGSCPACGQTGLVKLPEGDVLCSACGQRISEANATAPGLKEAPKNEVWELSSCPRCGHVNSNMLGVWDKVKEVLFEGALPRILGPLFFPSLMESLEAKPQGKKVRTRPGWRMPRKYRACDECHHRAYVGGRNWSEIPPDERLSVLLKNLLASSVVLLIIAVSYGLATHQAGIALWGAFAVICHATLLLATRMRLGDEDSLLARMLSGMKVGCLFFVVALAFLIGGLVNYTQQANGTPWLATLGPFGIFLYLSVFCWSVSSDATQCTAR